MSRTPEARNNCEFCNALWRRRDIWPAPRQRERAGPPARLRISRKLYLARHLSRLSYVDVEMAPPRLSAMWMLLIFEFDRNGNKASVTHTALGDDMLSEVSDIAHRAPE